MRRNDFRRSTYTRAWEQARGRRPTVQRAPARGPTTDFDGFADSAETDPDAVLVARAKADRRAFAALYDRYADPVYRYCWRRLGSREAAEDATGLVFVKALTALPAYREDGRSFRSWLFAIAHNVVIDDVRGRRPVRSLADAAEVIDTAADPEADALRGEAGRTIRGLLARLPPDQTRVLELRLAGLTGAEIAAVLGTSPGAVRVAHHRALVRLRALWNLAEGARDG
jgi:RNA polymerase sigma-70 factor, ECF subfamily